MRANQGHSYHGAAWYAVEFDCAQHAPVERPALVFFGVDGFADFYLDGEKFAERFLAILQPRRLVVYGNPGSEVRQALASFGAIHMEQIGGFAR